MPSRQQAAEAYLAVPEENRRSDAPIASRLSPSEIPHKLGHTASANPSREISSAVHAIAGTTFSPIQPITQAVLNTIASHRRSMELADLENHTTLMKAIREGASLDFLPLVSTDKTVSAAEFKRARSNGYVAQAGRDKNQEFAVTRARDAAVWVAERRVPNIIHFRDRFEVRDRRGRRRTVHTLEQVWVAKSTTCDDALRLIAIELVFGADDLTPEAQARREELAALGYEIQCAIGWWALIDPVRFIVANLLQAGLSVPTQMQILGPGSRIEDYLCTSCRTPMIRDEGGHGIVEVKGWPVHAGHCFNRVIDTGESDEWSVRL